MPSVLLHVCCAHCAAYCVKHWQAIGDRVTAYWYNPNIHPHQEYLYRLEAARALARNLDVPLLVAPDYDAVECKQLWRLGHDPYPLFAPQNERTVCGQYATLIVNQSHPCIWHLPRT